MKTLLMAALLITSLANASQKIVIDNDETERLRNLEATSTIVRMSQPTGRIKIPGPLSINDFCTVSLISENEIITAAHCFRASQELSRFAVFFEYRGFSEGPIPTHSQRGFSKFFLGFIAVKQAIPLHRAEQRMCQR